MTRMGRFQFSWLSSRIFWVSYTSRSWFFSLKKISQFVERLGHWVQKTFLSKLLTFVDDASLSCSGPFFWMGTSWQQLSLPPPPPIFFLFVGSIISGHLSEQKSNPGPGLRRGLRGRLIRNLLRDNLDTEKGKWPPSPSPTPPPFCLGCGPRHLAGS